MVQSKLLRHGNGPNGNYFHKVYKSFETCNFSEKFENITNKFIFLLLENTLAELTLHCCLESGTFQQMAELH
ncbi:hypothetical protein TNCT_320341 [Trichonephila clavata]|uniref:Uncharacterized protein n=1 Tax=Trichonephila clavata TaxID=2740835 RepID=A0A8X6ICZ8_TRICU|nr:hypothetical protein TNCT_320341 [Trichonephila clavata]